MRPSAPTVLLLAAILSAAPGGVRASGFTQGIPWTGELGVARPVADIMSLESLRAGHLGQPRMAERAKQWPDRSNLPQAPGAPEISQWPPEEPGVTGPAPETIASPLTHITSFTGATLFGVHPTFSFPPDCMGAVGPTQYVVFVNGRLVTFDKITGLADGVLDTDADVFFAGVRDGSITTDPRIRYDRLSGRWFLVIINTATPNRVLLAVSDAASNGVITPATVFTFFFFPIDALPPAISSTCFADHPTLGVDANALYIGTSNFCGASQAFNSCDGFVVRKSSVLGAGPMVVTALRGLVASASSDGPFSPQGVDNYDPAASEGYFIGVSSLLFGKLVLRRVSTPGGTPGVSSNIDIAVPSTLFPILVPHLGNTGGNNGRLSGVDDRLHAAHLRAGRLWTAHSIGVNNTGVASGTRTRNASRWYELDGIASPGVPSIVQAGTVYAPSATNTTDQPHYWMPSIMVSGQGHALMGFSTAGSLIRADAATSARLAGDAPGTLSAPAPYTTSTSAYNPPGDSGSPSIGRRWGDYTYTSLDPGDDMTMWTIQQFCDATNSYGCQVIEVPAPLPAAPVSADDVPAGQASVLTTVVGTSTAGSGFYDPGPDLGGGVPPFSHIGATVTAVGVTGTPPTVNGVTYVNPTQVVLDLNTTAATPSLAGERYTVTVLNPDGQAATGSMILRVTGPVAVEGGEPSGFALGPVRPNPAPGPARVEFTVARETPVRVTVLDPAGREVATLAEGVWPAGGHSVVWSGETAGGRAAAGMYFVRYEAAGRVQVRRFVKLR